jgi:pyruvate,water dikinase
MFLRGFESQTLQAQLDLNAISTRAAATPATRRLVLDTEPDALLDILAQDAAGQTLLEDLQKYFATYGHQIYNLDFVEPTQADDPRPVLATLQTLVRTTAKQPDANPRTAMIETRKTLEQHTRESLGPLRRRLFGKLLNAAQTYAPYRESALFYMGAGWPTLRRMALELGTRLTDSGSLSGADDVFYLRSDELEQACGARAEQRARSDLAAVAQTNRTLRHQRQRLHPPGRVPEDLRFKLGPFDLTRTMEMWETQKKTPTMRTYSPVSPSARVGSPASQA